MSRTGQPVASYAQAARCVLPGQKLVKPYTRKTTVKVRPKQQSGIHLTTRGVGNVILNLGLPKTDLKSVFYQGHRAYQIEFFSVEGKVRFMKIMKNEEARKRLELKEFVTEYQQICVTRVPADFPDINIRVAIERLGEIRIEGEGTLEVERDENGGVLWFSGKRFYRVKTEAFYRMKELPQVLDLGHELKFFVAYRGLPQRCLETVWNRGTGHGTARGLGRLL